MPGPLKSGDYIRQTISISPQARDRMNELAKRYKLTQPQVLDAVFLNLDEQEWAPRFTQMREQHTSKMVSKSAIKRTLGDMTPEQMADLIKYAQQLKGQA